MKEKRNKICFIVFLSVFSAIWLASILFLGFATLSENITTSIESWYAKTFTEKTLNLFKVSMWGTILSTSGLLVTLLFNEIKKKYL